MANRWHVPTHVRRRVRHDFEYAKGSTGDQVLPTSMVAMDGERTWRLWRHELHALNRAPFDVGPDTLVTGFKVESELQCFLALGWPLPCHVVDLYAEWRHRSNGMLHPLSENSLIKVCGRYGIDTMTAAAKEKFRQKFIDDAPFSFAEQVEALDYNEDDVNATDELGDRMQQEKPFLLPATLMRGRYVKATARVQHIGPPLDGPLVRRFAAHRMALRARIIKQGDRDFGVYDENLSFSQTRFVHALRVRGLLHCWPVTEGGKLLATDKKTRQRMGRLFPSLKPLLKTMGLVDLFEGWSLQCGADGRNRYSVMPFGTLTGRNASSSNRYIFGMPAGFRPLIKPHLGEVIVYCDWSCQEIGIAAVLSGDPALLAAFLSGDPYIAFAIRAGVSESEAHAVRKLYKQALLGVCYGMGAHALALRLGIGLDAARTLLRQVEHLFPVFWSWVRAVISQARLRGSLCTPFDKWPYQVHAETKQTTLRNFMMQATGASIMRLALIAATEEGLTIGGIVHDAFLLVTTPEREAEDTAHLLEIMSQAAERVCGILIPADHKPIRYPARYWDPDDVEACNLWFQMLALLEEVEASEGTRNTLSEVVA